ncbi:MAG: type I phosphomannose isomerase catalytic subunit [Planctomycetota bacterium]
MDVYPYKMVPLLKEKIWGGRTLERLYHKPLPSDVAIGEAWELADLPEGASTVANGPLAGRALGDVVVAAGAALMGPAPLAAEGRFPLLLKLLDAVENLSVQVHPDERAVREIPGAALKTECWYVLASDHGAIYKGVKPGVTADDLRAAIEADDVADVLRRCEVRPGDFHYLPAGTVHALGAGVVVAEVQTPSDTTYRVSDWGRGREVHVERAMQCIRVDATGEPVPGADGECLLKTDYFHVYLRSLSDATRPIDGGRPTAWIMLSGGGDLRTDSAEPRVRLDAGDTVLLPAALDGGEFVPAGAAEWLEIRLPPF